MKFARKPVAHVLRFVCLWIVLCGSAAAQTIADGAKLFNEDARSEAGEILENLQQTTGVEFMLETVQETGETPAGRFALERAREKAVFGAYVLIAVEARKIEIKVAGSLKEILTPDLTRRMRESMIDSFREDEFNEGLLELARIAAEELKDVRIRRPERLDWGRPRAALTAPGKTFAVGFALALLALTLLSRLLPLTALLQGRERPRPSN